MAKAQKKSPKTSPKPQAKKAAAKSPQKKAKPPQRKPPSQPKVKEKSPKKAAPPARPAPQLPASQAPPSATRPSPPPTSEPSRRIQTPSGNSPTSGIRYLTVQDLLELHRAVSADFGGHQAKPGEIESQYGLVSALQRPQATVFGKDAYPTIAEKAAVFVWALLQNGPFASGNRRVAVAALFAFLELNGKSIDTRAFDEKALETVIKRASHFQESGVQPENAFHDFREALMRAIA